MPRRSRRARRCASNSSGESPTPRAHREGCYPCGVLARILAALLLVGACGEAPAGAAVAFAPQLTEVEGAGAWVAPGLEAALEDTRWLRPESAVDVPPLPIRIAVAQVKDANERDVLRLVADATPPDAWRPRLGPQVDAVVEVE